MHQNIISSDQQKKISFAEITIREGRPFQGNIQSHIKNSDPGSDELVIVYHK